MPEVAPPAGPKTVLRLLLFIDGLGSGGAQRQFTHLTIGLARRGHRVTVAVYNRQDHFADQISAAGIDIVHLDKPARFSLKPIFALARLHRREKFDLVIAFLRSPAIKAELARMIAPGMTVIAAERSMYPTLPLPLGLRLSQLLHHMARFVTVNSAHQAVAMKREFRGLAGRIVTIHNGVDLTPIPSTFSTAGERQLRLVAVSSLMPYKNSLRLAEALALLRRERGLRVTLSWLGETFEGSESGGETYAQTCALLESLELEQQWRWLGVTRDVPGVLARHDALIHPSLYEGTSNAVCEAMAAGLPVLAGRIADHAEMLEETNAGIMFDPLDVRSIADAIARFANLDTTSRRQMGHHGRKVIEARFSFEKMISDYERLALAAVSDQSFMRRPILAQRGRANQCAD